MGASIRQGHVPGCVERIVALHAQYYAAHAGFGAEFESVVSRDLAAFCESLVPARDGLWLVMQDGHVEGSIAIDGSRAGEDGAHLRWFILSDAVRGHGLGNQLIATALKFCADRRYPRVYLWTFQGLDAARHLYEKHGFRLVEEGSGTRWGTRVVEQRFEARLSPARSPDAGAGA